MVNTLPFKTNFFASTVYGLLPVILVAGTPDNPVTSAKPDIAAATFFGLNPLFVGIFISLFLL